MCAPLAPLLFFSAAAAIEIDHNVQRDKRQKQQDEWRNRNNPTQEHNETDPLAAIKKQAKDLKDGFASTITSSGRGSSTSGGAPAPGTLPTTTPSTADSLGGGFASAANVMYKKFTGQ